MTERALWVAKSGLDAQQTRMAVISITLANVNTTGFKRARAVLKTLCIRIFVRSALNPRKNTQLPTGLQLGTGVRTVATEKLHTQGNVQPTDNALDVAIMARGFLQILMPNGDTNYTRDGSFKLDCNGQLVTSGGLTLNPAITVPQDAESITIGTDVRYPQSCRVQPSECVGANPDANFINPTGLEAIGENLYANPPPVVRRSSGRRGRQNMEPWCKAHWNV